MADTYRHKWQYLYKKYWNEWKPLKYTEIVLWEPEKNFNLGETMNSLLGNYVEVEYVLERPKDRGLNTPYGFFKGHRFCDLCQRKDRKKYWRHNLQRKHRRQWRRALKNMDYDNPKLDRRPERYDWLID